MLLGADTTDPVQDVIAGILCIVAVLTYLSQRQSRTATQQNDKIIQQNDSQADKLDDVHALVNNQLSEAIDRRDTAEAENVQLRADADNPGGKE